MTVIRIAATFILLITAANADAGLWETHLQKPCDSACVDDGCDVAERGSSWLARLKKSVRRHAPSPCSPVSCDACVDPGCAAPCVDGCYVDTAEMTPPTPMPPADDLLPAAPAPRPTAVPAPVPVAPEASTPAPSAPVPSAPAPSATIERNDDVTPADAPAPPADEAAKAYYPKRVRETAGNEPAWRSQVLNLASIFDDAQ